MPKKQNTMKLLNYYLPKILFFFTIVFIISCEKEDAPESRFYTSLVINNYHRWYGNSSWQDNFIFEIYKSQDEFDNYFSIPYKINGYSCFLPYIERDSIYEKDKNLYSETLRFDSIRPGTYYLKIFNANNDEKFVEFNKPHTITISKPLDSLIIFNTLTERYYINSFRLKEMIIDLDNNEISLNTNNKVNVKFWKVYPGGYAGPPPTVFFEDSVIVNNFPYKKSALSITINEFNSWWYDPYFVIEISGKSIYHEYYVKVFDLLNLNKRFSDSLVYFDSKQAIHYKLYGEWDLE